MRARAALRRRERDAALREAERAVALLPGEAAAWHARGLVRYLGQDFARATPDYDQALRLDPGNLRYLFARAAAHMARDDHGAARPDLEAVLRSDPAVAGAWVNLGLIELRAGALDEARRRLREGLRLAPDHPLAPRVRDTLRQLDGRLGGAPEPPLRSP